MSSSFIIQALLVLEHLASRIGRQGLSVLAIIYVGGGKSSMDVVLQQMDVLSVSDAILGEFVLEQVELL
jgi:hypothetical protein